MFILSILCFLQIGCTQINHNKIPLTIGFHSDDVPLYGAFELPVINVKTYSNKFDYTEIELQAEFTSPSGEVIGNVYGFFDGDGMGSQDGDVWKLRFMPTETGTWKYEYAWTDGTSGGSGSFTCISSDYEGPLLVDEGSPFFFKTMSGKPFHAKGYDLHQLGPMGVTWGPSKQPELKYQGNDWSHDMDDVHQAVMDDYMIPHGYNLAMIGSANHEDYPPTYWWEDDPMRFNLKVWQVTENIYLDARERGIYIFQFDGLIRISPVITIPTLDRWNKQLVRYYVARLSSISSHFGFNPTRENYKLPGRGYSKQKMNDLMKFCKASIPNNYKSLLTIHDSMYEEFSGWQDFAIRQHPSKHVEGNSKDSQQGNNNDRGVDIDDHYAPYRFPVIAAEDVWEGLTQNGVEECIRPIWGQLLAGIIPLYSEWNRWIEVQGTGVAEEPYRMGLDWWFEQVDYRNPDWKQLNDLVSSSSSYDICSGVPGKQYIAYREGNGDLSIDLSDVDGEFDVSFFDPFKGRYHENSGSIRGGSIVTFSPPFEENDVVVLLKMK